MRDIGGAGRIVIKIGTNLLLKNHAVDKDYLRDMTAQIACLLRAEKKVLIVTSGAVGLGAGELGIREKITSVRMRQACASIGQPLLMKEYKESFAAHGIVTAQILLTREVLNNRKSYLNLRNSVETLLSLGVAPVFNENDSISTAEVGNAFGDNDRLSALVASKVDADLLILLTDIDALYDANPRENPGAKPIRIVPRVTEEILAYAGAAGSAFSVGGMKTKVLAAQIAGRAGCPMALAHGREKDVLARILAGEEIGTLFLAQEKLANRERWILMSSPQGTITVDEGALEAMRKRKSLLPSGIHEVAGVFAAGDVVAVNDAAKIVSGLSSTEIKSLMGKHSSEIRKMLGAEKRDVVARPEDIVFLS
ncbi:MAG: glutamate 5-kinase [Spirochaetales bacterium]|jgi:glutamate 5-kinase|nr:glutamate 5-kinase [Spirochaetales bacterium]